MIGKFMFDSFISIPLTDRKFFITENALIKDNLGNIVPIIDKNGYKYLSFYWYEGYREYDVSFILVISFLTTKLPIKFWKYIKVNYKNDIYSCELKNISYEFNKYPLESDIKNYFFIPGYSNYVASKDGVIIKRTGLIRIKGSKHPEGRMVYSAYSDIERKNKNVGIHRLLSLAFLGNQSDNKLYDVNHIDGNPSNNSIKNLEWCTRADNINHAFRTGLRNDNRPVIVLDIINKTQQEFYSIAECERKLGLSRSVVYYRLQSKNESIYDGRYKFFYKEKNKRIKIPNISFTVITEVNNNKINFPSSLKCSKFLRVDKKTLLKQTKNEKTYRINGYSVYRS